MTIAMKCQSVPSTLNDAFHIHSLLIIVHVCNKKNFSRKRRNLVRLFKENYSLIFVFFSMLCRQTFAVDTSVKRGDLLTIFSDFLWSVITVITALK